VPKRVTTPRGYEWPAPKGAETEQRPAEQAVNPVAKIEYSEDVRKFFELNPAFNTMAEDILRNLLKEGPIAAMYPQGVPDEAKKKVLAFIYRLLVTPDRRRRHRCDEGREAG
jgi:hypothetical protein